MLNVGCSQSSQQGMALVITLILLSVTLLMAVAFLALSRRERNAVTTTTDTATARLAADAALANAEAQIVANIFATTNAAAYSFGLLVSTNYFNPLVASTSLANLTNVNYDAPGLSAIERNQILANLFYRPRVPVYLTNYVFHTNENRFYLDLNRNGQDEPNGLVTNVDNNLNGLGTANVQVGDPEWVGMLDRPDAPHGPNNRFVSRYAFIAVPVGNTLDLNAIHNQVLDEPPGPSPGIIISVNPGASIRDGFLRNEGVGSWEINLAAFLADLNTNEWGQSVGSTFPTLPPPPPNSANFYQYNQANNLANSGVAFDDARALLAYRYANNYNTLASVDSLYGGPLLGAGYLAFRNDNIDGYSDGPLMTGLQPPGDILSPINDDPSKPWAGADNTNHFFSLQEYFDPAKTAMGVTAARMNAGDYFSARLLAAGQTNSTYDRYTYYRMLAQFGSDSAPDSGKININYSNAVVRTDFNGIATNIAIVPGAETNFMAWTPTNFFLAAADRLLRLYTTNWFQGSAFDCFTNYTTVTNLVYTDPSNYLATFYGIHTNYFSYIDAQGNYVWNAPNGIGLTNLPLYSMTNQIPAFGITNIPVWVNGRFVYTPAVNRLLQLAANIYDATTNNFYPHVFRPLFSRDANALGMAGMGTNVFVSGYVEVPSISGVGDLRLSPPVSALNLATTNVAVINMPVNVYGVPWIIGAKKGFPNFNELYLESAFQLTRKLMVTRQSTNVPSPAPDPTSSFWGYYVMYNLSVSNYFGVECWNSYHSNYTRPVNIYVTDYLTMALTNDEKNFSYTTNLTGLGYLQTNNWQGYNPIANPFLAPASFQTNFGSTMPTNFAAVPVSMYRFNGGNPFLTTNLALPFETTPTGFGPYPQPHWGLVMTNNLRVVMVDTSDGPGNWRIIDYVQLNGPNSVRDLATEIQVEYDTDPNNPFKDLWNTNLMKNVPIGFANQFTISQGTVNAGNGTPWSATLWGKDRKMAYDQMNAFLAFTEGPNFTLLTYTGYQPDLNLIGAALMTNQMEMPYTPFPGLVVQDIVWQANDPLVHYIAGDLVNPASDTFVGPPLFDTYTYADNFPTKSGFQQTINWPGNLGVLNQRYMPWGGNPILPSTDTYSNTLSLKDPLVYCSDDWNFPTNKFPTVGWLGRVHRGTPWQTVYLKAADVLSYTNLFGNYGTNLWIDRTGDVNPFDAANNAPKKDWLLFDAFTTAFNDNATRGALSVNVAADRPDPLAGLAAWSALFSGVMVLSNNAPDGSPQLPGQTASSLTNYFAFPISPAGPAGTNSALAQLVQGIYATRTNFTNPDGVKGAFEHVGYILSVPQLSEQSPFLHWKNGNVLDTTQLKYGISDAMYEWLPQQVMSLLRAGPPRYVIYGYGQALKPAPNSLVTGGTYFGMCTNYQVVAESAARVVVRVDGADHGASHVVVESYNPLPPD